MAYVASNGTARPSVTTRLAEMARQTAQAYTAWRLYRRTLDELQQLSPRELDDLGLERSGLRATALEAAYGKAR